MSDEGSYSEALGGRLEGAGLHFALVVTRFHGDLTEQMADSARRTLLEHGVDEEAIEVVRVPGAWELPHAVRLVARSSSVRPLPDAILAIGCVIRGETPHFDIVAGEAARGLMELSLGESIPILLGLLTTETRRQAAERADPERRDKGREVALAALEMARLRRMER